MKRAVAHLEQYLDRTEGYTKGQVVLATVFGDVHDIGKNLVKTILSNNGYTVHDLGKQVPLTTIVEKAIEVDADVIGLSALLVSTSKQMPMMVEELDHRGLGYPVIIGGAAINRGFGRRILYLDPERVYEPGVFYCKDAFEGLETCDQLVDPERRAPLVDRVRAEAQTFRDQERAKAAAKAELPKVVVSARSDTRTDAPIPTPPFWGPQVVTGISTQAVYPHIDRNSLFKMSWQFRGVHDPERWDELVRTELEPRLERSMREAQREGWLDLQAVYGYWPALAEGDSVVVFDPEDHEREIARFAFPRQGEQHRLCLADYVRPRELAVGGERDVIALQVVTPGPGRARSPTSSRSAATTTTCSASTASPPRWPRPPRSTSTPTSAASSDSGPSRAAATPGLPRLPRPPGPPGLLPDRAGGADRGHTHRGLPAGAGAVNRRDRPPPPGGAVLRCLRQPLRRGCRGAVCRRTRRRGCSEHPEDGIGGGDAGLHTGAEIDLCEGGGCAGALDLDDRARAQQLEPGIGTLEPPVVSAWMRVVGELPSWTDRRFSVQ